MKKIAYFLIVFFSFFMGVIGVESQVFASETFATATVINVNTEYAGTLTESENEKFYYFILSSSGKVEIEHSNFSKSDGHYKLYNNKYDELASFYGSYDSNRGFAYDIDTYYLMAGTYYLKVHDCTGEYSFNIGFTKANETHNESQSSKYDYIGEAKYISQNKKVVGQLGLEDSQDIYSFNMANSGMVSIEHTNYSTGNNHYEILDSNGNSLHSFYGPYDSNKGYGYDIDTYTLNKGTYYIKVSEAEGFYNFKIKTDVKARSISISGNKKVVAGKAFNLKATVMPSTTTNKGVIWSSSNTQVASVSVSGKVKTKQAGRTTITVQAADGSGISKKCTVVVLPKKMVIKQLKSSKSKQLIVSWAKQNGVTGYQVQYSQKKAFSNPKSIILKKNKTSLNISKLKKGKKYYVRIRSYVVVNSTKYYSDWSSYKKVTIQ